MSLGAALPPGMDCVRGSDDTISLVSSQLLQVMSYKVARPQLAVPGERQAATLARQLSLA